MAGLLGMIYAKFAIDPTMAKKGMSDAERHVRSKTKSINKSLDSVKRTMLALGATIGGGALAKDFVQTAIYMDRMTKAMTSVTGSLDNAKKEMDFVRKSSDKLGLSFKDQIEGFMQLQAAAKGSKLEGEGIRTAWFQVMEGVTALQLPAAKTASVVYALKEMLSKGTVQAQEFKVQMGNAMPGMAEKGARAMSMSVKELGDAMKAGKIVSDDFIKSLGEVFHVDFGKGALDSAKSMQAELNRVKNEWFDFKQSFMKKAGASSWLTNLFKQVANTLKAINKDMDVLINLIDRLSSNNSGIIEFAKFTAKAGAAMLFLSTISKGMSAGMSKAADIVLYFSKSAAFLPGLLTKTASLFATASARAMLFVTSFANILGAWTALKAGWDIGSWFSEYSQTARDWGTGLVDATVTAWIKVKKYTKIAFASTIVIFKEFFTESSNLMRILFVDPALSYMKDIVTGYVRMYAEMFDIAGKTGRKLAGYFAKTGHPILAAAANKAAKISEDLAKKTVSIENKTGATIQLIRDKLAKAAKDQQQNNFDSYIKSVEKASAEEIKQLKEKDAIISDMYRDSRLKELYQNRKKKTIIKHNYKIMPIGTLVESETKAKKSLLPEIDPKVLEDYKKHIDIMNSLFLGYKENSVSIAEDIKNAFTDAFKGMEDQLVNFVMTGKASWKDLANSIIEQIVRIAVRQAIVMPLAQGFQGAFNYMRTPATTGYSPNNSNIIMNKPVVSRASGGAIDEHVIGVGQRTGRTWEFGENESELVLNQSQIRSLSKKGSNVLVQPKISITTPPGTNTETQQSDDGMNIEVMISNAVDANIRRGGSIHNTMSSVYGLNRAAGAYR